MRQRPSVFPPFIWAKPFKPLSRWQKVGITFCALAVVAFGVMTEVRGAFLKRRMTDAGVYFRAAWAVRTGQAELYSITDENNWHYHYPPLLAVLLVPLADPPPHVERVGMPPFSVSVGIWYVVSVLSLFWGCHALASALEATSANPAVRAQPVGCRRWWALRLLPILVCAPSVGGTLMRGQVNLVLLLLLCLTIAAVLRGRSFQAGIWLALAICIKVIPAFLLIYPAWRRDYRFLVGSGIGLVMGMIVVPAVVLGPTRTVALYRDWSEVLLRPAMAAGDDDSRADELIKVTRTDSQSFMAILHNTLYLDRTYRPEYAGREVRIAHWLIGACFTVLALSVAGWRRKPLPGCAEAIVLGMLALLMVLLSPISHLHYFALVVPLVMAVVAFHWEEAGRPMLAPSFWGIFVCYIIAGSIPHFPGMESTRDIGVAALAALILWLVGFAQLREHGRALDGGLVSACA